MNGTQYFYDTWKRAETLAAQPAAPTCGPGFTLNSARQCVCQPPNVVSYGNCEPPCPNGLTRGPQGKCTCEAPKALDASGSCTMCKPPNIINGSGHCVAPPTQTCKAGEVVKNGKCTEEK